MGECNRLILPPSTVSLEEVIASVVMKRDQSLRPPRSALSVWAGERASEPVNLIDGLNLPITDETFECMQPFDLQAWNSR